MIEDNDYVTMQFSDGEPNFFGKGSRFKKWLEKKYKEEYNIRSEIKAISKYYIEASSCKNVHPMFFPINDSIYTISCFNVELEIVTTENERLTITIENVARFKYTVDKYKQKNEIDKNGDYDEIPEFYTDMLEE